MPHINRRLVQGADDLPTRLIGTVVMFYTFSMRGRGEPSATFVELVPRAIVRMERSIYVLTPFPPYRPQGFSIDFNNENVLVHIDSLTDKIKIVPALDDAPDTLSGITMWESR